MSRTYKNVLLNDGGTLSFEDSAGNDLVGITTPTLLETYTLNVPTSSGTDGYVLKLNSGNQLAWDIGPFKTVSTITSNTTLDTGGIIRGNNAPLIITLPSSSSYPGKEYRIIKSTATAGTITINRSGSDTIDDSNGTSETLTDQYDSARFVSDGNGIWYIV